MLICGNCGRRLAGSRYKTGGRLYLYYKCNAAYFRADFCTRRQRLREDTLEDWLLANTETELESQRLESEAKAEAQERKAPDRATILRKMNRLKDLYVNELVDLEQYRADYERYNAQLAAADAAARNPVRLPDFQAIKEKVTGIETFYQDLSAEERQSFWRGLIREIRVDLDDSIHIFFK
ncbi:MAG: zinc ribbon domain-containing protein [Oscillibacter sp.]|nr:zinc ribbon domain-containing protein [Oscillibacter sp.]